MARLLEIGVTNAAIATLLALVVWVVTRRMRQPALAHMLWVLVLVLVKLVTPPLLPIPWQVRSAEAPAAPTAAVPAAMSAPLRREIKLAPTPIVESTPSDFVETPAETPVAKNSTPSWTIADIDWTNLLVGIWLAGSAIWLAISVGRLMRFHFSLNHASLPSDELQRTADDVAAKLGVRRFRVRVTAGRLSPLVWPIGVPTIVVPQDLLDILTEPELRSILTHEFAHLRRKDHWVRWLEFVATAIYWWHPVAWFVRRQILQSEELACDAWVVGSNPATAKAYANALFQAVEVATGALRPAPVLASRVTTGGDLKQRIEHVMNATCSAQMSKWSRWGFWFVAICILPLSFTTVYAVEQQERAPTEAVTAAIPAEPVLEAMPSGNSASALEVTKQGPARHYVGEIAKFRTVVKNTGKLPLTNVGVVDSYDPAFQPRFTDPGREVLSDGSFKWTIPRLESGERRTFCVQCACVFPSRSARSRVTVRTDDDVSYSDETAVEILRLESSRLVSADDSNSGGSSTASPWPDERSLLSSWPPAQTGRGNVSQHAQERQITQPEIDDASVLREQIKFLELQFNQIDALYKTGAPGGTVDRQSMAGFELARARGELALVEGNRTEATRQFANAEAFAATALKAISAAYQADRMTLDVLMQASNNLTDIRRRLIQVRRPLPRILMPMRSQPTFAAPWKNTPQPIRARRRSHIIARRSSSRKPRSTACRRSPTSMSSQRPKW
jgi:uncharacterized repeat protein (TIGR01451 family)